jgi:Xaa-Pro aminopeptidase
VLHYDANSRLARRGDAVLIDAGVECCGYTADITRTFPASGSFTPQQRDLYTAVLDSQVRAWCQLCPGA